MIALTVSIMPKDYSASITCYLYDYDYQLAPSEVGRPYGANHGSMGKNTIIIVT
jgi:hypothetical protein